MMWMLSPAELVWTIRSFDCCADTTEQDTVHKTMPAKAARPLRNACLLVIFIIPFFSDRSSSAVLFGGTRVHQETGCRLLFDLCSEHEVLQRLPVGVAF